MACHAPTRVKVGRCCAVFSGDSAVYTVWYDQARALQRAVQNEAVIMDIRREVRLTKLAGCAG